MELGPTNLVYGTAVGGLFHDGISTYDEFL